MKVKIKITFELLNTIQWCSRYKKNGKMSAKKEVKEAKTPVKKTTKKISKKKDSKSAKKVEKSKKEDNEITNVNVKETSTEEVTPKDNHKSIKSKDNLGNDDFDWTPLKTHQLIMN